MPRERQSHQFDRNTFEHAFWGPQASSKFQARAGFLIVHPRGTVHLVYKFTAVTRLWSTVTEICSQ